MNDPEQLLAEHLRLIRQSVTVMQQLLARVVLLLPLAPLWAEPPKVTVSFAPRDAGQLNEVVCAEWEPIREDQRLLRGFFHQSDLP